jgi:hypothetical protein
MTQQITLRDYCPKSKYGNHIQDILRQVVQIEDEFNHEYHASPIPKFERSPPFKLTITAGVAFGRDIIKSVLP